MKALLILATSFFAVGALAHEYTDLRSLLPANQDTLVLSGKDKFNGKCGLSFEMTPNYFHAVLHIPDPKGGMVENITFTAGDGLYLYDLREFKNDTEVVSTQIGKDSYVNLRQSMWVTYKENSDKKVIEKVRIRNEKQEFMKEKISKIETICFF